MRKKIIGVEKKNGYSFDVECSELSIYEVSSTLRALWKKLAGVVPEAIFEKSGNITGSSGKSWVCSPQPQLPAHMSYEQETRFRYCDLF